MIRKVLAGIKTHRLFVYLFVAVAVLGIAVTSTLTSDGNSSYAASSSATPVNDDRPAIDYYNVSLSDELAHNDEQAQQYAADPTYNSIGDLENALDNGSGGVQGLNYFTFARWSTVTLLPVPTIGFANIGSLVVAAFVSLANLMFTVGAIVLLGIGLLMLLVTSLDLLSAFMPTIDWFFAQLTGQFLFQTSSTSNTFFAGTTPFFVAIALFIVAIVFRVSPLGNRDRSLLGDLVISAIAIAALMGLSSASSKNWDNSNSYAVDQLNGDDNKNPIPFGKVNDNTVKVNTSSYESYAPWSFGYILSATSDVVNQVVNSAGGFISGISSAISNISTSSSTINGSDCAAYVTGMHEVAQKVLEGGKVIQAIPSSSVQPILAFDNLVFNILYKPAAEAAYGSTPSGDATWCRMWETARGADPVDQAYIARTAGMYSAAIGNNGEGGADSVAGVFLAADGAYADNKGKEALAGFFGNNLSTPRTTTAFKFYWAACTFQYDGTVGISTAFANAKGTKESNSPTTDGAEGDVLNNDDCTQVLSADDGSRGYSFGAKSGDALKPFSAFAWATDAKVSVFFIGFNVPAPVTSELANLNMAGTEALDFYKMVYGSTAGMIWPAAIVAVVGTVMMTLGVLPMQIGALILQMISVVALICFPLILLALILPIRFGRRAFFTVIKLFLSSKLVQLVFVAFIGISIALINMLNLAFDSVLNSTFGGVGTFTGDGTPLGTFISAILHAVAIGIAFYATKKLLKDVFRADVTTVRGAMQVGQNMSTAAINGAPLRELGFGQMKGLRPQSGFKNADIPGMGEDRSAESQRSAPQQPPMVDRGGSDTTDDVQGMTDKVTDAAATAAGAVAGTGAAGAGAPEVPGVPAPGAAEAVPPTGMKELAAAPSEAPVANDSVNLTDEQRQTAQNATGAIGAASGLPAQDINDRINEHSSASAESQLDDAISTGNEDNVREAVSDMGDGATPVLEGTPSNTETNQQAREAYFNNDVDNSDRADKRDSYRAGEMDVKAVGLDRIIDEKSGVGNVDNQTARSANEGESLTSQFAAPGMAEDISTSKEGGYGMEGLTRRMDSLPTDISGAIGSVMEGAFDRFDALGRTIQDSTQLQAESIRDSSAAQVQATEQQTQKLENLSQTIAAWFPKRNG